MITVHHLNNSRSQRILWLLEELGVPYDIRFYKRDPKTMQAPPALKKIHPLGKSPIVTDDDITIAETGAIVEYILERYGQGRLIPTVGTPERRQFTYWLHYAEGSAMPPLLLKLIFNMLPEKSPFFVRPIVKAISGGVEKQLVDPQLKMHMDFWESELSRSGWFAGPNLSAADIQMSFPLEAAATRADALIGRPHIRAFLERIHARPAYQRALKKGGPYEYANS
ncbi:glutathione S-transferase family protein [Kozakia baliensis]|uniref:glutathione S-transferase family protein n=1 Tax=Kozakia baliensis TaxID=153496 RepID=UPI0004963B59|nr:glutathione S-transferase [Kozakia baliensis]